MADQKVNDEIPEKESLGEQVADHNVQQEEQLDAGSNEEATPEPVADAGTDEKKTPSIEEELEQAKQEAAQNLDNWQRAVAELANYKRRQEERQKHERHQIKSEVLDGVISALDDIDLAFQNVPEELDEQSTGWVEGFRLVQRKLHKILDDQFVTAIDTSGEFDPNFHEAVSYEQSDDHEEGQIIAELRKGYQSGNRVIRPALVRVAQ